MKIKKNNFVQNFLLLLILFVLVIVVFNKINIQRNNFAVLFTFFVSITICIIGIIGDTYKYSLNKTYWYFMLFFMILAPLIQYISNYSIWNFYLDDNNYVKTNLLIIVFNIIYLVFYNYCKRKKNKEPQEKMKYNTKITYKNMIILFLLTLICFLVSIYVIGFANLFIRGKNYISLFDNTTNTIISNVIRAIPVYSFLYSILYYKGKKNIYLIPIINFVIIVILNFPTSLTRYWIGVVYIGIFLLFATRKMKMRSFDVLIIALFLFLFPLFQTFKWNSITEFMSGDIKYSGIEKAYNNVDFDAYSMFSRTLIYVKDYGYMSGKQIMGSLFFIIPRRIWYNKSIPSGELVAKAQKQNYTNLSCPIPAEGYIDFGIIGMISYAIIFAYILNKLDYKYWNVLEDNDFKKYLYLFAIGLLIFTLRGALHPAAVYIFIFYIPYIIGNSFSKSIMMLKKYKYKT